MFRLADTAARILDKIELARFQTKFPYLKDSIDSKDSFLEQLVKHGGITEQQCLRIKQQQHRIERNRELLAILRRRSFAHFEVFKDVLRKTKQNEVVQTLQGDCFIYFDPITTLETIYNHRDCFLLIDVVVAAFNVVVVIAVFVVGIVVIIVFTSSFSWF